MLLRVYHTMTIVVAPTAAFASVEVKVKMLSNK